VSRLIDELRKSGQAAAQPMGFRAARTAESAPRIALIASLVPGTIEAPADYVDGASAVLLRPVKSHPAVKTVENLVSALPDIPWGARLDDSGTRTAAALIEAGCDFLVFPSASLVSAAPDNDKTGTILEVESSLGDSLLRALNDLPLDAVLTADISQSGEPIAWNSIINIQRITNLLNKPLLVPISTRTTESELKFLWEAGVDGVVVAVDTEKPGELKELRRLIDKLPPRSARRHGKAEALLPRIGGEAKEAPPDEEEEEDE
jgi:hypothetical protein